MKFLKANIGYIVTAIIAISVTVVLFLLFFKPKSGNERLFKEKMELYDTMLNRERQNTLHERERSDKIIDELLKQDSVKEIQVKATKQRINEIPTRVNNLDRSELIRAIEEF